MPEVLTRRQVPLAVQRRDATPGSYDATARTVDLVAATGTPVRRYSWMADGYYQEVLSFEPGAVDLGRVQAGQCPLLDTHSSYSIESQIGAVQSARLGDGQLAATVRFATSDGGKEAEQMVADGTLTGVSIGYRVKELTFRDQKDGEDPVYVATKWELLEVSLCPVPADPAAGVRSDNGLHPCVIIQPKETRTMDPEEIARLAREAAEKTAREALEKQAKDAADAKARADAEEAAKKADASAARMSADDAIGFVETARTFGVELETARGWVKDKTPDEARDELLKAAAEKQRKAAPLTPRMGGARITQDERDVQRGALATALILRHQPGLKVEDIERGDASVSDADRRRLFDTAREYRGMSLLEMVRAAEEANGRKVRGLSKRELADLAFDRQESTSDFPNILANVANKSLRQAYATTPQTFKAWQRRATVPDFKQVSRTQLGGAPSFVLVPEGGRFEMGQIGDGKEVYALATYGKIFSVTRQALINDDLGAFTRVPEMFGRAAADFESDTAYAPLITNPNMGDSIALFHASHGNVAAAGTAIDQTNVSAVELAMSKQTGLEGRIISAMPRWLIVSVKDKVPAQQLVTAIQATATGNVNVYSNAFDVVVEARLNRTSGATPWYMAADYNQVDTFEYAYLEGEDGVYLEQRMGFETDGVEFKARLDFAVKAIDYRGLYENPGL